MKGQDEYIPKGFDRELSTDYEGRCGNCHEYMDKHDKYCKYCGTKRGEGAFAPFENIINCVYGPPIKVKYNCNACGHSWIVRTLGSDHSKYCPECGKMRIKTVESKMFDWTDDMDVE